MTPQLKALEALQQVDAEILELSRAGDTHPQRLAELERDVGQAKAAWQGEHDKLLDNERQRRDLESQMKLDRENIKKWESRLGELRTPREYSALSREIDIGKKSVETVEHQIQELKQAAAELGRAADQKAALLKGKQAATGGEAEEIRQKMTGLEARLAELQAQRSTAATAVEKPLLSRYEAIRKKRGVAFVPVIGGSCQGCHMNLPPQLYNQLRSGKEQIEQCPSCHRLIYAPEPTPAEAPQG
ncbi:MAG: zinc ribbon domain-containing protein [Deltaproteobacteria bacterium]